MLLNECRRAKIKLLAKKSIETGEDCDAIPDSMRQYLALQAMESGKPLTRDFLGRSQGLSPYGGGGMIMNAESNAPGKVGELRQLVRSLHLVADSKTSYPPFYLQVLEHRIMAPRWPKRHGSGNFLRARQSLPHLLHK